MNTNGRYRPVNEDEALPLLTSDHGDDDSDDDEPSRSSRSSRSSRLPSNSSRRSVWLQRLLRVNHVARSTAPQLICKNILWVCAPLGVLSGVFHWNSIATSIFNFLAIIPLSAALSDASDKLSDAFGDLLGALINATFGNAVELIVI